MQYTRKKLPLEKIADLIRYSLTEDQDYKILGSPVYLLMTKNKKLVSLKEPLDFFSSQERSKFLEQEAQLYVNPLINDSKEYVKIGKNIREILIKAEGNLDELEMSPYECSYLIREKLNKIWASYKRDQNIVIGIESFFIPFLIEGVFGNFSHSVIEEDRESDFNQYERGVLISSIFIFLLLHTPFIDKDYLQYLRGESYRLVFNNEKIKTGIWPVEIEMLFHWTLSRYPDNESRVLVEEDLKDCVENGIQKIHSRLRHFSKKELKIPSSVYGKNGFNESSELLGLNESPHTNSLSKEFLEDKHE